LLLRILCLATLPLIAVALVLGRLRRRPLGDDLARILPLLGILAISVDDIIPVPVKVGQAAHVIGVLLFLLAVVLLAREMWKRWTGKPE
jgi:uncharacterized SAM-binding protein YcdF (DUF218 family)